MKELQKVKQDYTCTAETTKSTKYKNEVMQQTAVKETLLSGSQSIIEVKVFEKLSKFIAFLYCLLWGIAVVLMKISVRKSL